MNHKKTAAAPGQGCIYKRKNSWEALIQRQGKRHFKASKNREEVEAWLEEMRATLPPPLKQQARRMKPLVKKKPSVSDYKRILAASEDGAAENVRKYRTMAAEARTDAEAARARRDAAAARIRELRALLGIGAS